MADLWSHREVLGMLARKDFQTRYKRATFGVLWAVVVPVLQALVMAVVFSRVIRVDAGVNFAAYVMTGILMWSYFATTLNVGSTAIVDGSGLTDKVWFPRAVLVLVPSLANLVGLGISFAALVGILPILGVGLSFRLLLLLPAALLLVSFTTALTLVLAALHVYFRDVRYLVQAALLVWLYVTPIIYPKGLLGRLAPLADFNPMTGVVSLFHLATVGHEPHWELPVLVSVVVTLALIATAVEVHRRRDRLFVDQL